jgi:hypothetical protein
LCARARTSGSGSSESVDECDDEGAAARAGPSVLRCATPRSLGRAAPRAPARAGGSRAGDGS